MLPDISELKKKVNAHDDKITIHDDKITIHDDKIIIHTNEIEERKIFFLFQ